MSLNHFGIHSFWSFIWYSLSLVYSQRFNISLIRLGRKNFFVGIKQGHFQQQSDLLVKMYAEFDISILFHICDATYFQVIGYYNLRRVQKLNVI